MQVTHSLLFEFAHGRGQRGYDYPASPAAGANFSHSVNAQWWERLVSARFTLTTSSAVANRIVTIDYSQPGKGIYHQDGPSVIQTASGTGVFNGSYNFGASDWNTGTAASFNLWGGWLQSGQKIAITVASIDTADQLSGIALVFERVSTGPDGYPLGGMDEGDAAEWLERIG